VAAGPITAAGRCCYEVGEEVHAAFAHAHRNGRMLDMCAIAREQLQAAGVADIRDVEQCTICGQGLFSHRREATRAGRQAVIAWRS
jgi:copper oxidase (laccase) domain-containing protein